MNIFFLISVISSFIMIRPDKVYIDFWVCYIEITSKNVLDNKNKMFFKKHFFEVCMCKK